MFVGLIIPMPFKMKRKIFLFISESRLIAKLQYGLKVLLSSNRTIEWSWLEDLKLTELTDNMDIYFDSIH